MSFIDYGYYQCEYGGTKIPPTAFKCFAKKSTAFVHKVTFNRPKSTSHAEVITEVKDACCAIADQMYIFENEGGIKTHESVGSYSVSFANEGKNEYKALYEIADVFLSNTGLLYRGIS